MTRTPFLTILVTAVLLKNSHQHLLSIPNFPEEKKVPPICDVTINGQAYCSNCVTSSFCLANSGSPNVYSTTCSGSTPVCGFDGSSYTCIASNANCQCPGTPGLSYMADPFNDHYYTSCSGTTTTRINCGPNYYNPQAHDCSATVAKPLCTTTGTSEDGDPTTCDGYIVCSASLDIVATEKCSPPTNYFNPKTKFCENPIPPFRCKAGYSGYYPDPFDCKRYYVCNGMTLVATSCCSATEQWDNSLGSCTTTANCVALPLCARETTTPAPSATPSTTTTTLNPACTPQSSFRCPTPDGNYAQCSYCAKTYFQCVAGTATLKTCSGNLLFNTVPTYPACLSTCPYYP